MIGVVSIAACLVAYAAGTYGAASAASEVLRWAVERSPSHTALSLLVAATEALVGFGTTALGVALALWTPQDDLRALVAAAAVGVGFGIVRSLRSVRAVEASDVDDAAVAYVRRMVRYGALVRAIAAAFIPATVIASAFLA